MSETIDYLKMLNPAQREAVMTLEGPVLVIAGAGSGKTRTLVYRVARLVETGVSPESILLLTFTRKAAEEMLDRAAALSDTRCRLVSGGTFHSLAHRVLRGKADLLGYTRAFTILDRADMEEIIQSLVPELNIPKGTPRFPKRSTVANILSKAANLESPIEEFLLSEYEQFLEFGSDISRLASLYAGYKVAHDMMDYDDLILNLRKLLARHEDVREDLTRQYRYVLVDEYQDTNSIQSDIVGWLAHEHRNVMVVGDDCQSIYSFRGADFRNMFDFPKKFPEAAVIKLEENYRSTQPILTLTNSIMSQAGERYTKCLYTAREGGESPLIVDTRTEPEQAAFVCRYIQERLGDARAVSDFAVLFRAGYHSFELEAELARRGMRYVKYGGFKFLESAHIKDFLAHLRVAINRDDAVSWVRVLRLVKNVGQAKSRKLIQWVKDNGIPPDRIEEWPGMGKGEAGLRPLGELFRRIQSKGVSPKKAVEEVLEYYGPTVRERFDDFPKRQRELEQLIPMAGRYRKLRAFLDDLVLDPPAGSADLETEEKRDALTLSTVHSAKGLEWPVVLVIWAAEGRFPAARAYRNPLDLEEERRLMYVAATRAKDELVFCYPGWESNPPWSSLDFAGAGGDRSGLSSFLRGLDEEVVAYRTASYLYASSEELEARPRTRSNPPGAPSVRDDGFGLRQGHKVRHPAFGFGVVFRLVGTDKVEVLFEHAGRKLLHLEYTSLERV